MVNELTLLKRYQALPIGTRVTFWAMFGIALISIALINYIVQREHRTYLDEQGVQLLERADAAGARLNEELDQLARATRFLARTPPPLGIARAIANDRLDPLERTPLERWRARLETIFSAFAESHPSYYQMRLVGIADGGRELARVELENGQPKAISVDRLQRKEDRAYYEEGLRLPAAEVHLSEINLNQEYGRVVTPHRRTVRAVAPVFEGAARFGFVVVNLDIGALLDDIAASAPPGAQVFMTNGTGDFLVHPDQTQTFGFDLGRRYRSTDQLPGVHPDEPGTIRALRLDGGRVYAAARAIGFDPRRPERALTLVYTLPATAVRAAVNDRVRPLLAGLVLSALILALLVGRLVQRTFSPLGDLTAIAREIGAGRYEVALPRASSRETGAFIRAFEEMLDRIRIRESENHQLYADLRQSETFANSVIETTPEAILVVDPNGRMVRVNSKTEQLFGYAAKEMIGQPVEMLLPDAQRKAHRALRQDYMSKAAQRVMGEGRSLRGQRKSGESFPVEIDLGPLQIGKDQFVIACVLDITKRKAAEDRIAALNATLEQQVLERTAELRTALALQQAVFDNAGVSLITADPRGTITAFNPAAETMLGYRVEEVVGQLALTAIHDPAELVARAQALTRELQREVTADFAALVARSRHGFPAAHEWTYVRKDGTRLPVLLSVTALRNADQTIFGYLGIAADLTERKEKEEQLRLATTEAEAANRAKSNFLANMSHEIRTPMNGVIGLTKLLQDTSLDRQQHGLLDKLMSSSKALLSILNDILDYSKIEAGKVELERVEFAIDDLLDTSATLFAQSAEEKGIEILLQVAADVPQVLYGDPLRLSQVLNNLVGNAVKFTDQGHIHVSVELHNNATQGPAVAAPVCLRFEVSDTGVGMSDPQLGQLFQAFHQADTSITRKYGGTGLGLSISHKLVELMHGEIGVRSDPGKGSTFWFTVQLSMARKNTLQQRALGQLRGMKVLVVDDRRTSLEILTEILKAWEFKVEAADSAAQGLEKLAQAERQNRPFDLFLIDWKMPDVDGLELTRRIEELEEQGQITRAPIVIMVTAYGHDQVLNAAGPVRLDAILDKPVTASRLFDTLVGIQNGQLPGYTALPAEHNDRLWQLTLPIHGAHVLLVEDNATNQFIATRLLSKIELRVDVAQHGQEAVQMVAARDYDAVLMDLQMPIMDGLEATRLIRNTGKGRKLPIIAMTAAAMLRDREATRAAGMNAHIAKPIDADELASTLVAWIPPAASPALGGKPLAARSEEAEQAFELPGLNLAAAVSRLDHNWSSLRNVLTSFKRDFRGAADVLRNDLENERYEDAKRFAHTIKGLARSIGAEALETSACRFERELVHGGAGARADFERDLEAALTAIAGLQDTPAAVHDLLPAQESLDIRELTALLRDLAAMVEDSIIVPADIKDRVSRGLQGHVSDTDIELLLTQVNQLNYAGAQQQLKTIAGRTGIDLVS